MIKNVSFIIPVYNEQKRISNVHNWIKWFNKNTFNCELILSLNGCNDKTEELLKKIKYKYLKLVISEQRGRGFAIIKALKNTKKRYACICSIDHAWNKKFYFSSFIMILGYSIIAIGIVTSNMPLSKRKKLKLNTQSCSNCLNENHTDDAEFCSKCGESLINE